MFDAQFLYFLVIIMPEIPVRLLYSLIRLVFIVFAESMSVVMRGGLFHRSAGCSGIAKIP